MADDSNPLIKLLTRWWHALHPRDSRDHQYHDCPGCGGRIVQARTFQSTYRFFDAKPHWIEDPEQPIRSRGSENFDEVMALKARNDARRKLNAQLWVFDPWEKGAMVPYWKQHVESKLGLVEHFCALGVKEPPADLDPQDRVPWTTPSPQSSAA